jgi:ankyrin repeat protein
MKHLLLTTIAAVLVVGCSESSVHEAADNGNIEAVKQHLAAGAYVNAKDKGFFWKDFTPLHHAARYGH